MIETAVLYITTADNRTVKYTFTGNVELNTAPLVYEEGEEVEGPTGMWYREPDRVLRMRTVIEMDHVLIEKVHDPLPEGLQ